MGEGQQEALLVSGGDLLRDSRRCRAGGITTMQVFLTKEASAPSVALHALPRCPTDLGSSTLEPPIPVGPLRPSATRRRPLPIWPLSPTAAHVELLGAGCALACRGGGG